MNVIFLSSHPPGCIPSQRFRFEQYFNLLRAAGVEFKLQSFMPGKRWENIQAIGQPLSSAIFFIHGLCSRATLFFSLHKFDLVFLHREAAPIGPPLVEWMIATLWKKRIIYDFDDAIWLTDNLHESWFSKIVRCRWKVAYICKWSYQISCGNSYLANYARQFNANIVLNPTTIDTENVHIPSPKEETKTEGTTIGWTGSRTTLKYLKMILPVLQILERKYPHVKFLVIADKNPRLPLRNFVFKRWKKETEISDLRQIDIGMMPMPDDPWTRGKCGFKALQYMAMEIPALVSPVGVNKEVIQHGIEGYWCSSFEEWFSQIEDLLLHPEKIPEMGKRGRQKVIDRYSVLSNADNFLSILHQA